MITVFTATFNRANTLGRVYSSLCAQSYTDFEWVVIDDGSTDETERLVTSYAEKADFPIVYRYQENSGKHVAMNRAVELARGELFIVADSDDSFLPQSLQVLLDAWNSIPPGERPHYKGVTCRCYDPATNKALGPPLPGGTLDSNDLDIRFKYGCRFDLWGALNTAVLRRFPFPEEPGLSFFPEGIYYDGLARRYKARYINDALLAYYQDQQNSLTGRSTNRSRANYRLWLHYMNDIFDYFRYDVPLFCKAAVGVSMDGRLLNHRYPEVMRALRHRSGRLLCTLFWPVGAALAAFQRKK